MSLWLPTERELGTDWHEPNANPQNTGVINASTPDGELAWERTDIGISNRAYPTEVGGMVVIRHNGTTALDADTGETLWNAGVNLRFGHVDRNGMIIGIENGDLVALDRTNGSELWRHDGNDHDQSFMSRYPAADLANNRAFYAVSGEIFESVGDVYGVDTRDGSRLFRDERAEDWISNSGVGYNRGRFFFGTHHNDSVVANDATDGTKLWESAGSGNVNGGPTILGGVVYYLNEQLVAVDETDGSTIWAVDAGGFHTGSPSISGDIIVTARRGGSDAGAVMRGWNREDGTLLWEFTDPAEHTSPVPPISDDGTTRTAYAYDAEGNLFAVDITDGTLRWTYNVRGEFASDFAGIPIVTDKVYVGDETRFVAVS